MIRKPLRNPSICCPSLQTSVVSMAYSQSEMLQKEVYLFERIDAPRSTERMKYMKCLVFIRPHKTNVGLLSAELKAPKYGSYYICKSSALCQISPLNPYRRFQQHYPSDGHQSSRRER